MLTEREAQRLQREVETKWSDEWRNNVSIPDANSIIAASTNNIQRYQVGSQMEFVDIELEIMAVIENEKDSFPTVIRIVAEFTKEYSAKSFGDWSISSFKVEVQKKFRDFIT